MSDEWLTIRRGSVKLWLGFSRLTFECPRSIIMVMLAQVLRPGQSFVCAFCSWHEIGNIRM